MNWQDIAFRSTLGSLKDVLENEAIQLDWNFRMSLIHDIVKVRCKPLTIIHTYYIHLCLQGMAYLHNSDVEAHGKLSSCNCLIDGRFVLKISDFGIRTLTTPSEHPQDQTFLNSNWNIDFLMPLKKKTDLSAFAEMLWVAPELLPFTEVPGSPATQKGDVYSFAIILEEIVVRGGPYETARQFLSIKGIDKL